jgi:hypothetical protein
MAKVTRRGSSPANRAADRGVRPAGPEFDPQDEDTTDVQLAEAAAATADSRLWDAEVAMAGIAEATKLAEEAAHAAMRAADTAEHAAYRVLEDARRMVIAARARAAAARAMIRTEGAVAEDLYGERAIDQADYGQTRAIESSIRAVDHAMKAAYRAQRRIDPAQSDRAY